MHRFPAWSPAAPIGGVVSLLLLAAAGSVSAHSDSGVPFEALNRDAAPERRLTPSYPASGGVIVIPEGAVWKFDDTGTDLGTSWRDPGYDDALWSSGPGVLGYGESYIVTPVSYGPDPNNKYPTTYFRIPFEVAGDPSGIQRLLLRANYDDGFVAYLNGTEAARSSMPAGTVSYGTYASTHEGGGYEAFDLSAFAGELVAGTNVLAVEVHQASPSSNDLVLDMSLETSTASAFVLRGPYLQSGTPNSVTVRWRTDAATNSVVRYGPSPGSLTLTASDAALTTEHEILVAGLPPDTRSYYSVGSGTETFAGGDSSYSFTTLPVAGTTTATRIWVIGDSGQPGPDQQAVRDAYVAYTGERDTDLWLMLGDNAYTTGTDAEYQAGVFDAYPEILQNTILWPTRGNHDQLHAGAYNDYYEIFTLPTAGEAGGVPSGSEAYYAFDYGDIHFICLDSFGSSRSPGGAMLTWLADDLAANTLEWTIAFWHHPPYTKGSHDSDTELNLVQMRENALPILEAAGVDLVLGGHSHSYERSFLLDSHYGLSGTLADSNRVDDGDGAVGGDGAYWKPTAGPAPHEGAVYAVPGSSSKTSGGSLDHPAMITSLDSLGSMVIDVDGDRLDAIFLTDGGNVRDRFTMVKGAAVTSVSWPGEGGGFDADGLSGIDVNERGVRFEAGPVPSTALVHLAYALPRASLVRLEIFDTTGRRVAVLAQGHQPAGLHHLRWSAANERGERVPAGLYFARLQAGDESRTRKIMILP